MILRKIIAYRKKGGPISVEVKESFHLLRREPSLLNFLSVIGSLIYYCLGYKALSIFQRLIKRLLSEYLYESLIISPDKYEKLYHWTPEENVDSILQFGLIGKKYPVYLTDDALYMVWNGFLDYRAKEKKKPIKFILLEIDTKNLPESIIILHNMIKAHEFTIDSVPADCIRVATDKDGNVISKQTFYQEEVDS